MSGPTIAEAEQQVHDALGSQFGVARISGYWVILRYAEGTAACGRVSPSPLRRLLAAAISDVLEQVA